MKINIDYLREFVAFELQDSELKELLAGLGLEVAETTTVAGQSVFEVEITPNRPDWLSHYGVAREIAAKKPQWPFIPRDLARIVLPEKSDGFSIRIEDAADCWRYSGCIVRDITVTESPPALRRLLESLGLRPINQVVDISNLVMMTCGQPLHIFDLERLQGNEIRVRRAKKNETIRLLDEREIALDENLLLIADAGKPLALAGIMGGLDSGISEKTRHIFIESACFNPLVIRRASRSLGFKTDASYRFERGMDAQATVPALKLALHMLAQGQARPLRIPFFQDVFPRPAAPVSIRLEKDFPGLLTGIPLDPEASAAILRRLGFALSEQNGGWEVQAPSHRVDITCRQDLVEEIIRVHGYEHLRSLMPLTVNPVSMGDRQRSAVQRLKTQLTDCGFNEVINYVFQSPEENLLFGVDPRPLELKNPLGKDFSVLKNSLLAGMLKNTALNANQFMERVALFEIGNVFARDGGTIVEKKRLAITAYGLLRRKDWQREQQAFDFPFFKSLLESLCRRLRLACVFKTAAHPAFKPDCCFAIELPGRSAGICGELSQPAGAFYKLDKPVFAAEIDLPALLAGAGEQRFRMWNRFPWSRRDFTFLMAKTISYQELSAHIERVQPPVLERFELIDVYQGPSIPADKVSFSMAFTYRADDRTLTGDEVNGIHQGFVKKLAEQLRLIQR
jgi:phenylalanyl-tRNA synthetase beta chain